MRRLIAGCGYLGLRVARLFQAAGDEVHVLTRSTERARHFQALGWHAWVGDVTRPETLPSLAPLDTALWSIGFDPGAAVTAHDVKVGGLRHLLDRLPHDLGRLIYISSTGVYGQTDGSVVDERTPCQPVRESGRACLAAEELLLGSEFASRCVILRLAGIYGPQRLPRMKQLLAGQPLEVAPSDLLNLIHVDDAAHVVQRAADWDLPLPRVYLVADGQPVERREFYREIARLCGAPPAQFTTTPSARADRHRSRGCKRVSNARMIAELGITLRYPSYREGIMAKE